MTSDRHPKRQLLFTVVLLFAGLVYAWFVLTKLSLGTLVAIPSDDAFYYFKIARNIVAGQGCTFDGIVPTNGFHPLWMVLMLPVFSIFPSDLETPMRVVLAGSGLLGCATLVLLYRVIRRHIGGGMEFVAVAVCLLPPVSSALINGLETGLLVFAITVLLWASYRFDLHAPSPRPFRELSFGICLGLIALCRLDSVFVMISAVCLTIVFGVLRQISVRRCIIRLMAISAGFGVVFSPYCIWNMVRFGHIMPVSGAMKSSFPALRQSLTLSGDRLFGAVLLAFLWVLLVAAVLGDSERTGRWRRTLGSPLTLLVVACTLHFAHAFLFLTWGVYWWHFSIYGLAMAVGLAEATGRWTSKYPRLRSAVIGTLILVALIPAAVLKVHEYRVKGAQHRAWLEGAEWAREHTPPNTVFAIADAGLFGYFSDRRVINLDGKANGYAYRNALYYDTVDDYLRDARVEYIAHIAARYVNGNCRVIIPRVNRKDVVLPVSETQEVFRSRAFPIYQHRFRRVGEARFTVWRYAKESFGSS